MGKQRSFSVVNSALFSPKSAPNTIGTAVLDAVIKKEDIVSHLLAASQLTYITYTNRFYKFGVNDYIYGVPRGDVLRTDIDYQTVQDVIESEVGEPIENLSVSFGSLDSTIFTYVHLQDQHAWTYLINIAIFDGDDYFVKDIIFLNPDIEIHYEKVSDPNITVSEYLDFPSHAPAYYYGDFKLVSASDIDDITFYYYNSDSNIYPELAITPIFSVADSYFPVIPVREFFASYSPEIVHLYGDNPFKDDEYYDFRVAYHSGKKALDLLSLDIDSLIDNLEESPDIDKIWGAYITIAVNINSDVKETKVYLFNYFRRLAVFSISKSEWDTLYDEAILDETNETSNTIPPVTEIQSVQSVYNKTINFNYITVNTVTGSIGKVGSVTRTLLNEGSEHEFKRTTREGITISFGTSFLHEYTFKYQETLTTYVEVTVHGLNIYSVLRKVLSSEKELLLPVDRKIVKLMGNFSEEKVLLDAMNLAIYAYEEVNESFLQSGTFQVLLIGASVLFAIFSGGTSIALTATFFKSLALKVLIGAAVAWTAEWIGEKYGLEYAVAFVVVATFLTPQKYGGAGGSISSLPTAAQILQVSSAILIQVTEDLERDLKSLKENEEVWDNALRDRQEELDAATDLLGDPSSGFDPLYMLEPGVYLNPDETPSEFYARTLNSDGGLIVLDFIDTYHDFAIELPKASNLFVRSTDINIGWFKI